MGLGGCAQASCPAVHRCRVMRSYGVSGHAICAAGSLVKFCHLTDCSKPRFNSCRYDFTYAWRKTTTNTLANPFMQLTAQLPDGSADMPYMCSFPGAFAAWLQRRRSDLLDGVMFDSLQAAQEAAANP